MDIDNPEGVTVILVNKYNKKQELKRKVVHTKNGKIPLRDLCDEWCISNVCWNDEGVVEKLNIDRNGYSDMSFSFINEIVLTADNITGVNQSTRAMQFMNKTAGNPPPSVKKPIDVEINTVQDKQIHPNVQRTNVLSSLVNKTKAQTEATSKPAVVTAATSSKSGGSLDDIEKLAALRDKGILTEEEFQKKKKQILGL
jgi:hypothetical protein